MFEKIPPLEQLISLIEKRQISCEELLKTNFRNIEKYNPKLAAFIQVSDKSRLIKRAQESDKRWTNNNPKSKIDGISIAVKDNIHVEGLHTTCASKILQGYQPKFEATSVTLLRNAGAIIIGKTHLDEFAMGASTETTHQITRNPWDTNKSAGGSSGGSAAAVSSYMANFALGSDTGGSVRQPASFCGITGLKPTYGRVSRYGLVAYASSLDHIGFMAQSIYGVTQLLNIAGKLDERDATSIHSKPVSIQELQQQISDKKIALIEGIEQPKNFSQVINQLQLLGANVESIKLETLEYIVAAYYLIATAEASSNLGRYDGVKYGLREPGNSYQEMLLSTRTNGFGKEVQKRIALGNFVLSAGYYEAYYQKAQDVRKQIQSEIQNIFQTYDAIITPTTPSSAFELGKKDFMKMYKDDITTIIANLTGIPAVTIPYDLIDGLPIGVQIMGNHLQEHQILNIAYKLEELFCFRGSVG